MNNSVVLPALGKTLFGATLLIVAACSSTPTRDDSLEAARAVVSQVEAAPTAGEVAANEVEQAHNALRQADALAKQHASTTEIDHQAYLARRHAEIAQQQIAIAHAKQVVAQGDAERQKIVLQAQANRSAQRADIKSQQAALATEQASEATQRAQLLEKQLADLNAKKTERGMVLTLGDVLFDTGKATLKPGAQSTLNRLAEFLKNSSDSTVVIEGHTDSVGSDEYNLELSQRRAEAVKNTLQSRNIRGERISAVGKGKSEPVAGNDNAAGRQQNRRVEIIIQDPNASSG